MSFSCHLDYTPHRMPAIARRRRTALARWGLLVTTVVMGAVLVVTGTVGFVGARRSADAVARAAVGAMALAARRDLALAADRQQALDELREELADQGLAFVGLADGGGRLVQGSGAPATGLAAIRRAGPPGRRPGPHIEALGGPGGARAVVPLRGGPGRGWRAQNDRSGADGLLLVLDARPAAAAAILSRGRVGLATSLAATGILVAAAVFFWRLSRRADRYAAELARDERLKVLGQMSAVLGHEIRNPLAALKGHAQLLVERLAGDHPGRAGAEIVVREAQRLERLTGQVLAFARDQELATADAEIAGLLGGAAAHAGADPVEVRVAPDASSWRLDPERMDQVLVNLLINARQASPAGEPVLLEAFVRGRRLVIEVLDRGPGFDPGIAEAIFEPFQTTRIHGTGLGLHLARRIVERHGGTISAGNREGGGAAVRIELPGIGEGGAP